MKASGDTGDSKIKT